MTILVTASENKEDTPAPSPSDYLKKLGFRNKKNGKSLISTHVDVLIQHNAHKKTALKLRRAICIPPAEYSGD